MGTLSILNAPESLVDISLLKGGRRTQCPARKSCTAAIVASQPVAGVRHDEFLHVRRHVAHDDRHVGADSQPCNYDRLHRVSILNGYSAPSLKGSFVVGPGGFTTPRWMYIQIRIDLSGSRGFGERIEIGHVESGIPAGKRKGRT
jgi:hypothetical protein